MKQHMMAGCLLAGLALAGCESAELTAGALQVRTVRIEPSGCRLIGTVRDREGGGLRSFEENRAMLDARLRNEAARLGGDALAVVEEARGDSEQGHEYFVTGVAGLSTPNVSCTNCILVTARVLQCGGALPPAPAPSPERAPSEECAPAVPRTYE